MFLYQDEIYILLTQRSRNLKSHSGEVCFPGGKYDEADVFLSNTALRETYEEIGLKSENIVILGRLVPLITMFGVAVFPFVGLIKDMDQIQLKPNFEEVDAVLACPLNFFLNSPTYMHQNFDPNRNNNKHYSFRWTSNPDLHQNLNNTFLKQVLGENNDKSFFIWGLTGLYCILTATICLNQRANFKDFVMQDVVQHLQNNLLKSKRFFPKL